MKKLCLCALILLCGCDRPEHVAQLNCGHWDVDAKIYKDKVVMDIVNTGSLIEPNEHIPTYFMQQGQKQHIVADRYVHVFGSPENSHMAFEYYKSLSENLTDSSDNLLKSVGLLFVHNNETGFTNITDLVFDYNGDASYKCHIRLPYNTQHPDKWF